MKPAIWGGIVGVAIGMAFVVWVHSNAQVPSTLVLLFWPTSILGFGYNGGGGWTGFLVATVVLGGQALLYGGFGAGVGALAGSYFREEKDD